MPRGERRPRGVDVPLTRGSLGVRQAVLGKHHEDTHRSAMDVYSRLRRAALRPYNSENYEVYREMAAPLEICFEMVKRASEEEGGAVLARASELPLLRDGKPLLSVPVGGAGWCVAARRWEIS